MPIIVTSSWFHPLPDGHIKISTSRGSPRGHAAGYRKMKELAPGDWFKSCATPAEYRDRYFDEILGRLRPDATVARIHELADGKTPVLVCFEAPNAVELGKGWCHRALLSAWLHDTQGMRVKELSRPDDGYGWDHPLLHPSLRKNPPPRREALDVAPWIGRKAEDRAGNQWQVIGQSSEHPDQADISNTLTGEIRSISKTVLEQKFGVA